MAGAIRPGTARAGPAPRRPPSIMPVMRPRTAAGPAKAPAPPPFGKTSAQAFRVEQKATYHGEVQVPSILFIGKAAAPTKQSLSKQKLDELSKYKLRPGALQELGVEEQDELLTSQSSPSPMDRSSARLGSAARHVSIVDPSGSYTLQPYGGKREIMSLRKQIVETEDAALEARLQAQSTMKRTQCVTGEVERKVEHMHGANTKLDSELEEIERQIEELKRISRTQIDEIKSLREQNKTKESSLHEEQRELERMEGTIRASVEAAKAEKLREMQETVNKQAAAQKASSHGAAGKKEENKADSSAATAAAAAATAITIAGTPAQTRYEGDKGGVKPGGHDELVARLLQGEAGEGEGGAEEYAADKPSEDFVELQPWRQRIKAPSDWSKHRGSAILNLPPDDPAPPDSSLELEHVFGFRGHASRDAVWLSAAGRLVYPASRVCVVHDVALNRQQLFQSHTAAVVCVAGHPGGSVVASGEHGKNALVLVWDSESLAQISALWGFHHGGVVCVAFSQDGNRLVSAGNDADGSVCVWDWRRELRLAVHRGDGSSVLAIKFTPDSDGVVSVGPRHVVFWRVDGTQLEPVKGNLNNKGSLQTFLSVGFLKLVQDRQKQTKQWVTLVGNQSGEIYLWLGTTMIARGDKAHRGPVLVLHTPVPDKLATDDCAGFVLSGGADGKVIRWEPHPSGGLQPVWTLDMEQRTRGLDMAFGGAKSCVRGVALWQERLAVGTAFNEIVEFTAEGKPRPDAQAVPDPVVKGPLVQAHALGAILGMDVHPSRPEFVTVGEDRFLRVWSMLQRKLIRAVHLSVADGANQGPATAVCYSPEGDSVAVGFGSGDVWVLDVVGATPAIARDADRFIRHRASGERLIFPAAMKAVSVLRYSADGQMLAVGTLSSKIVLFVVEDAQKGFDVYLKHKVLSGHSGQIRSIDFSEDGGFIQSTDSDAALLHWQLKSDDGSWAMVKDPSAVVDCVWATWTSPLGWPVQGLHADKESDLVHDNAVIRCASTSRHGGEVVAGEGSGRVRLHRFPCLSGAQHRRYDVHSTAVAHVRFGCHDERVISAGSRDMSVMQWRRKGEHSSHVAEVDPDVDLLCSRESQLREYEWIVRLSLEEKGMKSIALQQERADGVLQEVASHLKVDGERLRVVKIQAEPYTLDIALLPNPAGWAEPPTPGQLLASLDQLINKGTQLRKALPSLLPQLDVESRMHEDDTDFVTIKQWEQQAHAPSDWAEERGSKLLNYLPTHLAVKPASRREDEEGGEIVMELHRFQRPVLRVSTDGSDDEQGVEEYPPLELEYVHGFNGRQGPGSVQYAEGVMGESVVFAGDAIAVVQDGVSREQLFFTEHSNEIACFAVHPADRTVVASAELGPRGFIQVWSTEELHAMSTLHGFHGSGVAALKFWGDDYLLTVGKDANSTIALWNWKSRELCCLVAGSESPVLAIATHHGPADSFFVSVGVNHIKFWRSCGCIGEGVQPQLGCPCRGEGKLLGKSGIVGNLGRLQTMLCVTILEDDSSKDRHLLVFTGTQDGSVYVWRDRKLCRNIACCKGGPVFDLIAPNMGRNFVVGGGKDGCLRVWEVRSSTDIKAVQALPLSSLTPHASTTALLPAAIRSVSSRSAGEGWLRVLVGTDSNQAVEMELDVRDTDKECKVRPDSVALVVQGHSGAHVRSIASHPDFCEFATVGDDGCLRIWDCERYCPVASLQLDGAPSVVEYSPMGTGHIAVGFALGGVAVLDAARARTTHDGLSVLVKQLARRSHVSALKYSPDGRFLAVASSDNNIDVLLVTADYTRWGVCKAHKAVVKQLDWSADSTVLRSCDTAEVILLWNVERQHKGQVEQVKRGLDVRDTRWSTFNCPLTWAMEGLSKSVPVSSHLQAVDRSHDGTVAVMGDAFGCIRVFGFPCREPAESVDIFAHASAVVNLRFSFDDSRLLSASAHGKCVLQWRYGRVPVAMDDHVRRVATANVRQATSSVPLPTPMDREQDDVIENLKPYLASIHPPIVKNELDQEVPFESKLLAEASEPLEHLELEHVHGYRGHDRHGNVLYSANNKVVYFVAGVCIIFDVESNIQRFFREHTADVMCIARHSNGTWFASGQAGPDPIICVWDSERPEVATVQSTTIKSVKCLATLRVQGARGVCAVCFAADNTHLVSVSDDDFHSVIVWNWTNQSRLVTAKGDINQTLAVGCNPFDFASDGLGTIVTCGIKHVKFWTVEDGQLLGVKGEYAGVSPFCNILNVAFTPQYTLTGTQNGTVYVWAGGVLQSVLDHAPECPVFGLCTVQDPRTDEQGNPSGHFIVSGGHDGVIRVWNQDLKPLELGGIDVRKAASKLAALPSVESLSLHSLAVEFRGDSEWPFRFLVGTGSNEIVEVTTRNIWSNLFAPDDRPAAADDALDRDEAAAEDPEITRELSSYLKVYERSNISESDVPAVQVLVVGHTPAQISPTGSTSQAQLSREAADANIAQGQTTSAMQLRAVAAHPYDENQFATCGADAVLRIWNVATRRALAVRQMDRDVPVQAMCYAPVNNKREEHLVVGSKGRIHVLDVSGVRDSGGSVEAAVDEVKVLTGRDHGLGSKLITSLKFSNCWGKDGEGSECYLAAGSSDGTITLLLVDFAKAMRDTSMDGDGSCDQMYSKHCKLKGHGGAVRQLDFSKDISLSSGSLQPQYLQSNCAAFELRFWDISGKREMRAADRAIRRTHWLTYTCPLGWATTGIPATAAAVLPPVDMTPTTDHNMHDLLVTTDERGGLALSRFPCLAGFRLKTYGGHSGMLSSVRFTHGGQYVVSVSDADLAVFQWRRHLAIDPRVQHLVAPRRSFLAAAAARQAEQDAVGEFSTLKPFAETIKQFRKVGFDGITPEDAKRAATKSDLALQHVHGCKGSAVANTARYTSSPCAVFAASAVLVLQGAVQQDMLFQGHEDDILCVAVHKRSDLVATGEAGEEGQICVWDCSDDARKKNLKGARAVLNADRPAQDETAPGKARVHRQGISALAFSEDASASFLVSVGNDNDNVICVWDWRKGVPMATVAGDKNKIVAVACNPFDAEVDDDALLMGSIVTVGENHVTFWAVEKQEAMRGDDESKPRLPGRLVGQRGVLLGLGVQQTGLSIAFKEDREAPEDGCVLIGNQDGSVYVWNRRDECWALDNVVPDVHDGPVMCVVSATLDGKDVVTTTGYDGFLRVWDRHSFSGEHRHKEKEIDLSNVTRRCVASSRWGKVAVSSLDCAQGKAGPQFLVGTASNEVFEITLSDLSPETAPAVTVVVQGHAAGLATGLAVHPCKDTFATVGSDGFLRIWDCESRCATLVHRLSDTTEADGATSVDFRTRLPVDGDEQTCELAVGLRSGQVMLLRITDGSDAVETVATWTGRAFKKTATSEVVSVKFSPDGALLAAGCSGGTIEILDVEDGCKWVGECKGHVGPVTQLDWSEDSEFLQSNDSALRALFWRKFLPSFRLQDSPIVLSKHRWHTLTCPLGWPTSGVFLPGREGSGVNAVDRSADRSVLLLADDSGNVVLTPYPTLHRDVARKEYHAHSSPVSVARFSSSGKYAMSLGGSDLCVMQWKVTRVDEDEGVDEEAETVRVEEESGM